MSRTIGNLSTIIDELKEENARFLKEIVELREENAKFLREIIDLKYGSDGVVFFRSQRALDIECRTLMIENERKLKKEVESLKKQLTDLIGE